MKLIFAMVLIIVGVAGFFAIHSFQAYFSGTAYLNPQQSTSTTPVSTSTLKNQTPSGGAQRNSPLIPPAPKAPSTTSPAPDGFQGPTGQPHIVGPSGPPPGS